MTYSSKLAVLVLTSTLAACGGGGSGDVALTASSGNFNTQPVDQDRSTLSEAVRHGGEIFQRAQSSLNALPSQLRIDENFAFELIVGDEQVGRWTSTQEVFRDEDAKQFFLRFETEAQDAFLFVNAPNGTPDMQSVSVADTLDYSTYGLWLMGDEAGAGSFDSFETTTDLAAFFGGIVTTIEGMPTTGSATYTGGAVAAEFDRVSRTSSVLFGRTEIDVDFASRSLTGDIALSDGGSNVTRQITLSNGTISGNTFSVDADSGILDGNAEGVFTGPSAAELVGTFDISNGNTQIRGAFGAAR